MERRDRYEGRDSRGEGRSDRYESRESRFESRDRDNNYERRDKKTPNEEFIYGVRAVLEAIRAGRGFNKILIQKGMDKELFLELKEELKGHHFQLQFVPQEKLNSYTEDNHQGVVALVSPITYHKIEEVVEGLLAEDKKVFVLALDRITDIRNFGAIARTAECEGVDAILIPNKGSAQVTADAIKTSAGALNRIKVCKTENFKESLFYIQQCGLRVVACTTSSIL